LIKEAIDVIKWVHTKMKASALPELGLGQPGTDDIKGSEIFGFFLLFKPLNLISIT